MYRPFGVGLLKELLLFCRRNAVDSTLEEMDLASSREETIHSDEEQFLSSYLSRSAASFSRFYDSN